MPQHPSRLWLGPLGNPTPPYKLGPAHHGSKGLRISIPAFKGFHRVTQGDPLLPKIFNVAVDVTMRHWVAVVGEDKAVPKGLGQSIQRLVAYFYAKNGLITSTRAGRLQKASDVLTNFFNRVDLRMNTHKMTTMVCQLCYSPGGMLEEAYTLQMTGEGPTYQNRLRRRIRCLEYKAKMSTGSLQTHLQTQHSVIRVGRTGNTPPLPPRRPTTTGFPFQRRWT